MDREREIIELGVASSDTKGALVTIDDSEEGYKPPFGLSAD